MGLDEIAGLPKKLAAQGKTIEGQPPISELTLEVAYKHLSEEVLLRTPEESPLRAIGVWREIEAPEWSWREVGCCQGMANSA
jgi:hypothetical protein